MKGDAVHSKALQSCLSYKYKDKGNSRSSWFLELPALIDLICHCLQQESVPGAHDSVNSKT